MTVSAIVVDRQTLHRNTPDHVFYLRAGGTVQVVRDVDRERLERTRDQYITQGAQPV